MIIDNTKWKIEIYHQNNLWTNRENRTVKCNVRLSRRIVITRGRNCQLTEDDEEAHQYGGQCAHAKFQFLAFLDQFAVLAPKAVWAYTAVTDPGVLVQANATVPARAVQTLVLVHAAFAVRRHDPAFTATIWWYVIKSKSVSKFNSYSSVTIQVCLHNCGIIQNELSYALRIVGPIHLVLCSACHYFFRG